VLGARLNYPLPSVGDIHHKLIAGIDYKDSQSVTGPNGLPESAPITETPLSLSYAAQVARPEFQGNVSATYITNIPGGPNGFDDNYYNKAKQTGARKPQSYNLSSNFPSTNWQALRLNASGGFPLPQDWQGRIGINSQFSNDLLLPSEQFGAGGVSSVRGYPERIISGDQGFSTNFELYTPELSKLLDWPNASLRGLLFWDLAGTSLNDSPLPATGKSQNTIEGVGLGLRLSYKKDTTVKFDVGWAQKTAGTLPLVVNPGDIKANVAVAHVF
jgi:hemolysin activation/secretion protein